MQTGTDRSPMRVYVGTLTPARAQELLDRNPHNRHLNTRRAADMARDIQNGRWAMNGDAIRINCDGSLIDGQHRCAAVVAAGMSIDTLFIEGLDKAVMNTIDTGRQRTLQDVLHLAGHADAKSLAAATRCAYLWARGGASRMNRLQPTRSELLDYLDRYPTLSDAVALVPRTHNMIHRSVAQAFTFFQLNAGADATEVAEFMAAVINGLGSPTEPAFELWRRLVRDNERHGPNSQWVRAAQLTYAWNAHVEMRPISKIVLKSRSLPELLGPDARRIELPR